MNEFDFDADQMPILHRRPPTVEELADLVDNTVLNLAIDPEHSNETFELMNKIYYQCDNLMASIRALKGKLESR